jgi:transposase
VATRGRASTASTTASTNGTTAGGTPGAPRPAPARPGSPQAELAALRVRVAELESQNTLLSTERDILRQAAKYFAGETRW